MPIYEFKCGDCGATFEINAHLSERDEKAVCPDCGSRAVKPVFSGFSLGIPRTSMNPTNFYRPDGPVTPLKPTKP
jgi:putative FmdB family regulatory protein